MTVKPPHTEDDNFHYDIQDTQVIDDINLAGRMVDWNILKLPQDLELPAMRPEEVGIFIGQDVDECFDIILTRIPTQQIDPVAKLTRFVWTVVSKISNRY